MIVTKDAKIVEILDGPLTHLIVETEMSDKSSKLPCGWGISTRSKLAQVGMDIMGVQNHPVSIHDNKISRYTAVWNYNNLDFTFRKDDAVCRFFNTIFSRIILEDKVEIDPILQNNDYEVNDFGVIELKPQPHKFHLKQKPRNIDEIIDVRNMFEKQKVDELVFEPYEFAIVETSPVKIPKYCYGLLNSMSSGPRVPCHIGSPLIDPGFEGTIRLEFYNNSPVKLKNPIVYFVLLN